MDDKPTRRQAEGDDRAGDGRARLLPLAESARGELGVQSVGIAVEILDAIAAAGRPVRLAQVAEQVGMPRARVHRYLKTMKQLGLVWQERSGERYGLGWKLFHLGQSAEEQFEIKRLVEEPVRRLSREVDATVATSVPANGYAVTLMVETPGTTGPHVSVLEGKRLPPHATAQGRIVLAFAEEALRERMLALPRPQATARTLTDQAALRERLAEIRARLYDVNLGELWLGYSSFAAPVLDRDSRLQAVVAILALEQEAPAARQPSLIRAVQQCAAALSRELGSDAYVRIGIDA